LKTHSSRARDARTSGSLLMTLSEAPRLESPAAPERRDQNCRLAPHSLFAELDKHNSNRIRRGTSDSDLRSLAPYPSCGLATGFPVGPKAAAPNQVALTAVGVCIMIILKSPRQQGDGWRNRRFLQWQSACIRDAELGELGIMSQSAGSSISTRPDLNIDPAVADLPQRKRQERTRH
jgi:hypothetical protein